MRLHEKVKFKLLQQTYRYQKRSKKEEAEADKKEDKKKKEDLFDEMENFLDGLMGEEKAEKKDKQED